MAGELRPVEDLPGTYRRLVSALVGANRNLARAAASRLRYRGPGPADVAMISEASFRTCSYLVSRNQSVLFFFLRGAVAEEIILQLKMSFRVRPLSRKALPGATEQDAPLLLRVPPFFATGVDPQRAALLAKALHAEVSSLVFLAAGDRLLGAVATGNYVNARVARLDRGATSAVICYQRTVSPSPDKVRLTYEPRTFLSLVEQLAEWAKQDYQGGPAVALVTPDDGPRLAAWRILKTAVRSWVAARQSCAAPDGEQGGFGLTPEMGVSDFRADVVLRLRPDGTLAERNQDDAFRLRMSASPAEESPAGGVAVSLGPPDFLVSGTLHQRLVEAMQEESVTKRLFRQSGLDGSLLGEFHTQLAAAAAEAAVFRVERHGDQDRDVVVAKLNWQGTAAVLAAVLLVKLTKEGDGDYSVQVIDDVDSMKLLYTDIPGTTDLEPSPWLPRYLLALVDQLKNWLSAVQGGGVG